MKLAESWSESVLGSLGLMSESAVLERISSARVRDGWYCWVW